MVDKFDVETSSDSTLTAGGTVTLVADPKWAQGSPWWGGGRYEIHLLNITKKPIQVKDFSCVVPMQWTKVTDGNSKFSSLTFVTGKVTGKVKSENWASLVPAEGELVYVLEGAWPGEKPEGTPTDLKFDGKAVTFNYDTQPTKPTGVKVDQAMGRSLHLSWTASTDKVAVIGYTVKLWPKDQPNKPLTRLTRGTKAVVGGLTPSTDYVVQVQARNAANKLSDWSEELLANSGTTIGERPPWDVPVMPFIDYAGTTATSSYNQITPIAGETKVRGVSLGFITMTDPRGEPCWGGQPTLKALDGSHNKADVAQFVTLGGTPVISMGGWTNHIPELIVEDEDKVYDWYTKILDAYKVKRVDFDIEGDAQRNKEFLDRHLRIVTRLLKARSDLRISYTLPVDAGRENRPENVTGPDDPNDKSDPTPELTPTGGYVAGFNIDGKKFLRTLAEYGITPSLVNGMVMTMGNKDRPQGTEAIIALKYMHRDLKLRFPHLTDEQAWSRIGACPMYGINDGGEMFPLHATKDGKNNGMQELVTFATEKKIGSVGGWSANRDWASNRKEEGCTIGGGDISRCTWVDQKPGDFLKIAATFKNSS
ncbi:MAG: fibronectin type III domain-containing protein [Pseudonocardiaceae bacterium]